MDQSHLIRKILDAFCTSSGQKVSNEKTHIFFSKNVGHTVKEEICNTLNFSITNDLGKYLGVPLLHSRTTKDTYNGILVKMQARLSNWKANSLSLAGRTTLVKSVLTSIPSYTMQTALIPTHTCNMIDSNCRKFLWGETETAKRTHLLSWKNVGKPKQAGGFGVGHARTLNHAFMMKASWGLIEKKDSLWARVLRSKYSCGSHTIPDIRRKASDSNLWKGICLAWKDVEKNFIWRIGDGSRINFWNHNWVPSLGHLTNHVTQVSSQHNLSNSLNDFLLVSGNWDEQQLRNWLPDSVVNQIMAMSPPSPWKGEDQIAWGLSADGSFSLKSAYFSLIEAAPADRLFKLIWTWKGPERIRYFLGLTANDALLTNHNRMRRHMTHDPTCPRCGIGDKTTIHVLRDCPFAKLVWRLLLPFSDHTPFFNCSLHDWMISNLSKANDWSTTFGVATSTIWFYRNKFIFESCNSLPKGVVDSIIARTDDIRRVFGHLSTYRKLMSNANTLIRWLPPQDNHMQINTDGSFDPSRNNAACGGIIRDHMGRFVKAFSHNIGCCSIMQAELWGILKGIEIAVANGFLNIVVDSDSSMAINFVKNGVPSHHPCFPLVQDITNMLSRLHSFELNHTLREANSSADPLAKKGHSLPFGLHIFDAPPHELFVFLLFDSSGCFRMRGLA
ncbi:hypothetical protein PIB30_118602 [Stylosanthes scabra]|uniref:RNase H type-1 domain-containing protein n=1 Tax=Stylosanthes scabra TaxID=79078 RepID=A0ABU6W8B0_9FABA|nr:hypothetical protein [Stylosanthes scabra]